MCGIIGYIGEREAQPILLNGLKRLEYRGYDSCGVATYLSNKKNLSVRKLPGKIKLLEALLKKRPLTGTVGIGHCRWATHGAPNQINAHPHFDCKNEIVIVHNGIIENYALLKSELIKEGHKFKSQTDTEVIVHLIEKFYKNSAGFESAVRKALSCLEGSFAIAAISKKEPDKLIGARFGSPLVVGVGRNENFLASDVPAILDATKEAIFLGDNEMAVLTKDKIEVSKISGEPVKHEVVHVTWDVSQAQKQGWPHFMLKEINEQPRVLEGILNQRVPNGKKKVFFEELKIDIAELLSVKNIMIVACGTAYHAGLEGKYIIEEFCKKPVAVDLASEFRYRDPLVDKDTLVIAISQSGETADTLAAVREAKKKGSKVLAICNVLGSSLVRESDGVIYTHAGPEIGVASTKAYTAQLAILYLFAFYFAYELKTINDAELVSAISNLQACPNLQKEILKDQNSIKSIALRHSHFGSFLFLGRNVNYPSALEGALKLKEISYIPAEGYAAGEMKHGPIALIDEYRAVVCIAPNSKIYEKMVSNIQEIRSRRGKIIAIATQADTKIKSLTKEVILIPKIDEFFSPLIVALPLQLLAYHIAIKRGCDVDQPRNLAKSVTVE
ncbi:MAG: glutamine--fructose-6-phosphate transaminase (isomerizing) [Candidatus Omnitrophica bacterium]|nr:glutamine--fructose-6-phosphate transaminase (isomerizing) [Candidatus Omnitrophota bacterium]